MSRSHQEREQRQLSEQRTQSGNTGWCILVLIPFIIGIVIYQIQLRKSPSAYLPTLKWTAFNQLLGVVFIIISVSCINSSWWAIVIAVISMLGIQITNLFSFLHLRDCVKEKMNGNIQWLPAIVFGYVATISFIAILSAIIVVFIPDVNVTTSYGATILGVLLGLAFLGLAGWWYKSQLEKKTPQLVGHFFPIAIITMFAAAATLSLAIVVIAWFIFKGVGKMSLDSSSSGSGSSLKPSSSGVVSCASCRRLGDYSCPHFKESGTPNFTCDSWMP